MNASKVWTTDAKLEDNPPFASTQMVAPFPLNVSYQANITIVTAFIDIGKFDKGSTHPHSRGIDTYIKWANQFRFLLNPLVVYTDSDLFSKFMLTLRENLTAATKIIWVEKNSSWAFHRKEQIREIFNIKNYPRYNPGTTVPEYACAMHFKYEAMSRASTENYFHTNYFAWIDIGLFRYQLKNIQSFLLELPPDFNQSRVAVNQVYTPSMNTEISVIIKQKLDWVCGCIFMGERGIIIKYAEQYKRAVDYLIAQNLMNSDQQVIYAMYTEVGRNAIKPEIDLQLYSRPSGCKYNRWFYLGYIMKKIIK